MITKIKSLNERKRQFATYVKSRKDCSKLIEQIETELNNPGCRQFIKSYKIGGTKFEFNTNCINNVAIFYTDSGYLTEVISEIALGEVRLKVSF